MNFNKYYTATAEIEALTIVGHEPSNTWIGRSQVLSPIYANVLIDEGDEIHDLAGGTFLVAKDGWEVTEIKFAKNDRHIFEKSYGARHPHDIRLEKLVADGLLTPTDDHMPVDGYRT